MIPTMRSFVASDFTLYSDRDLPNSDIQLFDHIVTFLCKIIQTFPGSRASFCIYGLLSGCVLAGFLYVRKKASEMEDMEVKVDDSEALGGYGAPQGVPSAIPVQTTTTTTAAAASTQDLDYQW